MLFCTRVYPWILPRNVVRVNSKTGVFLLSNPFWMYIFARYIPQYVGIYTQISVFTQIYRKISQYLGIYPSIHQYHPVNTQETNLNDCMALHSFNWKIFLSTNRFNYFYDKIRVLQCHS